MHRRQYLKLSGATAVGVPVLSSTVTADPGARFPILGFEFIVDGSGFNGPPDRLWSFRPPMPRITRKGKVIWGVTPSLFQAPPPNVEVNWRSDEQTGEFLQALVQSVEDSLNKGGYEDLPSLAGDYRPKRLDAQKTELSGGDIRVWGEVTMMRSRGSAGRRSR